MTANLKTAALTPRGTVSVQLGEYLGYSRVNNVKNFGAVGNGSADDTTAIQAALNDAFGTSGSPHGGADSPTGRYLNNAVYFPPGHYKTTSELLVTAMESGRIFGAGKSLTYITNVTTGTNVFRTNDCSRSVFEHMTLGGTPGGASVCFYLGGSGTGLAITGNTFYNIAFAGGDTGLLLGADGFMGSENLIYQCWFTSCATAGIRSANANMLDTSVIACSIDHCGNGIYISTGQIENIQQVSFANNTIDIFNGGAGSWTNVMGCRTESVNFVSGAGNWNIESCSQQSGQGYYLNTTSGSAVIVNGTSYCGKIKGAGGRVTLIGCDFDQQKASVTGVANNGSGLFRLTMNANYWVTGDTVVVRGVGGATTANGTWTVTVISTFVIDLQGSTFASGFTSGGIVEHVGALLNDDLRSNFYLGCTNPSGLAAFERERRITKTAAYTIPQLLSGVQFDNLGAGGAVTLTLPNMDAGNTKGTTFGFYVGAAQTLTIKAANSMTIRSGATVSAANGTIASSTIGNYVELTCIDGSIDPNTQAPVVATKWVVKYITGTWTVT